MDPLDPSSGEPEGILPVLSNVSFLVLAYVFVIYGNLAESAWTTAAGVVSTLYHVSRWINQEVLWLSPREWRELDWITANLTIVIAIGYFLYYRSFAYRYAVFTTIGAWAIYVIKAANFEFWVSVAIIGSALAITLPRYVSDREWPCIDWWFSIPGWLLLIAAVITTSLSSIMDEKYYWIFHSLWHVFALIGAAWVVVAIEKGCREVEKNIGRRLRTPSGIGGRFEGNSAYVFTTKIPSRRIRKRKIKTIMGGPV